MGDRSRRMWARAATVAALLVFGLLRSEWAEKAGA